MSWWTDCIETVSRFCSCWFSDRTGRAIVAQRVYEERVEALQERAEQEALQPSHLENLEINIDSQIDERVNGSMSMDSSNFLRMVNRSRSYLGVGGITGVHGITGARGMTGLHGYGYTGIPAYYGYTGVPSYGPTGVGESTQSESVGTLQYKNDIPPKLRSRYDLLRKGLDPEPAQKKSRYDLLKEGQ